MKMAPSQVFVTSPGMQPSGSTDTSATATTITSDVSHGHTSHTATTANMIQHVSIHSQVHTPADLPTLPGDVPDLPVSTITSLTSTMPVAPNYAICPYCHC